MYEYMWHDSKTEHRLLNRGLIETVEQDKIIKDAKSIGEFYIALPDNMPHDTKQMTIMMYFFPDEMIKMGGKE